MKSICKYVVGVCLLAPLAHADTVFDYRSGPNGNTVTPAVGATSLDGFLMTSWIFGEVSVDPSLVGKSIVGQGFFLTNPTPDPITLGLLVGIWAADGAGGGPGTQLDVTFTSTIAFLPTFNYISVDSGFATPAGNFWVGYAFENYATPTTTAAELNSMEFDLSDGPTVGTSLGTALLGSQASYPLGNNPAISGQAGGTFAQFLQVDTPEPSSGILGASGILLLAAAKLLRQNSEA